MRLIDADELASKIAGHSNYHGDSILAAIYCMTEGKQVGNIRPAEWKAQETEKNEYGLLPCPFCGGQAVTSRGKKSVFIQIHCGSSMASSGSCAGCKIKKM